MRLEYFSEINTTSLGLTFLCVPSTINRILSPGLVWPRIMSWSQRGGAEGTGAGNINLGQKAGGVGNVPQEWNWSDVQRYAEYGRGFLFRSGVPHRSFEPRQPSAYWYKPRSTFVCEDPGKFAYQLSNAQAGPTVPSAVRRLLIPARQNCVGMACGQATQASRLGRAPAPPVAAAGRPLASTSSASAWAKSDEGRAVLRAPLAQLPPVDVSNATLLAGQPLVVLTECGQTAPAGHTVQFDGDVWSTAPLQEQLDAVLQSDPRIITGNLASTSCGPLQTPVLGFKNTQWIIDAQGVRQDGNDASSVLLQPDGCCTIMAHGVAQGGVERWTATQDGAPIVPTLKSDYAFVTVVAPPASSPASPSDACPNPATGLLENGHYDGQEWTLLLVQGPNGFSPSLCPVSPPHVFLLFVLDTATATTVVDSATGDVVSQLQFSRVGQQATLVWSANVSRWTLIAAEPGIANPAAASYGTPATTDDAAPTVQSTPDDASFWQVSTTGVTRVVMPAHAAPVSLHAQAGSTVAHFSTTVTVDNNSDDAVAKHVQLHIGWSNAFCQTQRNGNQDLLLVRCTTPPAWPYTMYRIQTVKRSGDVRFGSLCTDNDCAYDGGRTDSRAWTLSGPSLGPGASITVRVDVYSSDLVGAIVQDARAWIRSEERV